MKSKEALTAGVFFLLVASFFFYKLFLGNVPFPGDLLIAHYQPWKSTSFLGYNPSSYPNKDQYFDALRQFYPWKTASFTQNENIQIPLWNPYNFSGAPLLANFQSAVFYPLNIFYLLTTQILAWTILVFFQPFLASFFTYLFAQQIGMGKRGAILSGIAYGYSLFMSTFLEYNIIGQTILWLPLILFSGEKIIFAMLQRNDIVKRWVFVFIFAMVFSLFAGHLQLFIFVYGFTVLYFLFRVVPLARRGFKELIFFSFLFFSPLGIGAVQLLPTFELIKESARTSHDFNFLINILLLQPPDFIRFFIPDFFGNPATKNYLLSDPYPGKAVYIGLPPLIFALLAITRFRKNFQTLFFTSTAFIIILFIANSPITQFLYRQNIPFFSTSSPANAIFLLSFSLAILSGFGFDDWLKNLQNKKVLIVGFLVVFIIFIAELLGLKSQQFVQKNVFYSSIILTTFLFFIIAGYFLKKEKIIKVLPFLLIFLTIFDLFYFFQKFNPFVPRDLVFPQTAIFSWLSQNVGINRFWGYGSANIEANFATQYKLFSPDGYDPLYPKRYGEFIQSSQDGKIHTDFTNITRSDAVIASGFGESDFANNFYRQRVLDVLGVKYILDRAENGSTQKTFLPERYKLVYEENGWKIFENLETVPRAFLAQNYKVLKDNQDFEKTFFSADFDVSKTIFIGEQPSIEGWRKSSKEDNVVIDKYDTSSVNLSVNSDGGGLLFLSDTYYPGWEAFINGRPTKIYQADYAFRAISVSAGEHKITFIYRPQSFLLGGKISIISILATVILIGFIPRLIKIK